MMESDNSLFLENFSLCEFLAGDVLHRPEHPVCNAFFVIEHISAVEK